MKKVWAGRPPGGVVILVWINPQILQNKPLTPTIYMTKRRERKPHWLDSERKLLEELRSQFPTQIIHINLGGTPVMGTVPFNLDKDLPVIDYEVHTKEITYGYTKEKLG